MRHQHKYFPVKFAKNLRTLFSSEHLIIMIIRSSHQRCSLQKGVLRSFTKFSWKHLSLRPATLLKKRLWHRYFPVYFLKFLRTPVLQNTSGRLLLDHVAFEIIQLSFSSNGSWKESICQRNVSFALLKLAEWRSPSSWENFLLKNRTHNVVEKLFLDPFLKYRNGVYLWISSLKFYAVYFYWMLIWGLLKCSETKLETTCFYFI